MDEVLDCVVSGWMFINGSGRNVRVMLTFGSGLRPATRFAHFNKMEWESLLIWDGRFAWKAQAVGSER